MTKKNDDGKADVGTENGVDDMFEQALAASLQRQSDRSVSILGQILVRNPYHAAARHLLGAEYAQAGKMNEAVIEMATALELNPNMPLARFQLGLILLSSARVADAESVWHGLDGLGSAHVLNRFRQCMLQITQGNLEQARLGLAAAMAENIEFPALNNEMLTVINMIALATKPVQTSETTLDEATENEPGEQHFLVSTYVQSPTLH